MRKHANEPHLPIALILTTLCALTTPAQEPVIIDFPDKNLEAAIRQAINKPKGDIQQTDLVGTGFTSLTATNANIADLTGLEYCTDLTWLALSVDGISDISVLASLTNLKELNLPENQISDISALAGLSNLEDLDLAENQISDISALASLTNLTDLSLGSNLISDLSALAGLTNLIDLYLDDNPIRGIRSWITIARIECRGAWRALGSTKQALLVAGVALFVAVIVTLRVWARRVSKRYTREP